MLALENCEEDAGRGLAREAVNFGGIEFRLGGDAETCRRVACVAGSLPAPAAAANTVGPKFAACCRLELSAAHVSGGGPARLRWQWHSGSGELETRFAGAQVSRVAGAHVARAWLGPDPRAAHFLLSGLCALLVHQHGGVMLHAASVVLVPHSPGSNSPTSGVVAFVGPSGAGKSTACGQVRGAPAFSIDRLALVPAGSGTAPMWLSHPLPGGTPPVPDMPRAAPRWLPLLGALRVLRAEQATSIESCSPASSVALLRESAFQAGLGPGAEVELLATLERLARSVPIGRLHQSLGASSETVLRRWLVDQVEE